MDIWKSIGGMLTVELTSAEPEQTLAAWNAGGMELHQLQRRSDLTCRLQIRRKDYRKAAALAKKRGDKLAIVKKSGIYWRAIRAFHRPVLLAGMGLLLFLALFLPTRVLFVRVEGNNAVPERQILAAAEECGIGFGASRREVRSEKVKNGLLARLPQLQWAGVNTKGCVATISVRERTRQQPLKQTTAVSHIQAARDGYILSITATSGTPLVQVGNTVKKGQTLISGYTDCGICIRAARAEGEVFAQTNRILTVLTPESYVQRGDILEQKKSYSLLLGKKRINLWKDSGIWDSTCGRISREYRLTLPGGFSLPVALACDTLCWYSSEEEPVDKEAARSSLSSFSQHYLSNQMIAGIITHPDEVWEARPGVYLLTGQYICSEMIGREHLENGAAHEQSD